MKKAALYLYDVVMSWRNLLLVVFGFNQPHKGQYWLSLLFRIDNVGNAFTGGDYRETISSRAAKARNEGKPWGCVLCKLLGAVDKNHCDNALDPTKGKYAVIPD